MMFIAICSVFGFLTSAAAGLRWLRVAQREHYSPGRSTFVLGMWLRRGPSDALIFSTCALITLVFVIFCPSSLHSIGSVAWTTVGIASQGVAALIPLDLSWRGRDRKLVWTPRLKRFAGAYGSILLVLPAWAIASRGPRAAAACLLLPLAASVLADAVLLLTRPIERKLAHKYVVSASRKLHRSVGQVVAITGSFGKTTVKNYVVTLLQQSQTVTTTPSSFNNLLGISTFVNNSLEVGVDTLVLEMGTYGIGEIAEMCRWFPPEIACITAIGDVHLERMKDRSRILRAKGEITDKAEISVLCVDDVELSAYADELSASGRRVLRVSQELKSGADVIVAPTEAGLRVSIFDHSALIPSAGGIPRNVACAVGIAAAAGLAAEDIIPRIALLPSIAHRGEVFVREDEYDIIDDTYNSNPPGFARAIGDVVAAANMSGGIPWVVTPGMIELGVVQEEMNRAAAKLAVESGCNLVVLGRTNARALRLGALDAVRDESRIDFARDRTRALEILSARTEPRDVVLFESDLPDHYP